MLVQGQAMWKKYNSILREQILIDGWDLERTVLEVEEMLHCPV